MELTAEASSVRRCSTVSVKPAQTRDFRITRMQIELGRGILIRRVDHHLRIRDRSPAQGPRQFRVLEKCALIPIAREGRAWDRHFRKDGSRIGDALGRDAASARNLPGKLRLAALPSI